MTFTLRFSTRDRMIQAMKAVDNNPKYRCTAYGRDWSKHNFSCPWSPMFYIEFQQKEEA